MAGWGACGRAGVSLPSPPFCLQGDPGKQGDPGRDVSTSGGGGFGLCSCWGRCPVPRSLVRGSAAGPSPVPSRMPPTRSLLPEPAEGHRCPAALCSPHLLSLQGLPGLRGEQGPPGTVGPLGPPGVPVSTSHPVPWGHVLPSAVGPSCVHLWGLIPCPAPASLHPGTWGPLAAGAGGSTRGALSLLLLLLPRRANPVTMANLASTAKT